ncbi:cupin domain-containing protein [Agriterribacter sp.]|uniref:cupin domain-containing protein n=1 Tax=Agriterribacter sp. TaxID=2821509 RepID=UPI002C832B21|nr:cupin domain-containing protein [Agriterribacter sp.]HRO45992.1 cupin domain-containing protein [Agriterribacter sp.]HRQ17028.1 cupin domain-containing protein [Agriterribacter sp.]
MKRVSENTVSTAQNAASTVKKSKWKLGLSLLFYPTGVVRVWRSSQRLWIKLLYSILALPVFLTVVVYAGIVVFAAFLPELDCTVGNRTDKTIYNREGNYAATFVKTGRETNNAYELVEVELEPHGGNDWHYHSNFVETFTVVDGRVRIGRDGKEIILDKGQTTQAGKKHMHYFKNALTSKSVLMVKVTPAAGLEKTLRVAYGLINDGLLKNNMTENPWHMCLLFGYSQSYLPGMPAWFQEPLINALAKIAQWKGEDELLRKYYR